MAVPVDLPCWSYIKLHFLRGPTLDEKTSYRHGKNKEKKVYPDRDTQSQHVNVEIQAQFVGARPESVAGTEYQGWKYEYRQKIG